MVKSKRPARRLPSTFDDMLFIAISIIFSFKAAEFYYHDKGVLWVASMVLLAILSLGFLIYSIVLKRPKRRITNVKK